MSSSPEWKFIYPRRAAPREGNYKTPKRGNLLNHNEDVSERNRSVAPPSANVRRFITYVSELTHIFLPEMPLDAKSPERFVRVAGSIYPLKEVLQKRA